MTMDKLVVFGASGLARVVCCYFTHDSPYTVAAFTVDAEYMREDTQLGLPVVPFKGVEVLYPPDEFGMFVAVAMPKLRAAKCNEAKAKGYELASCVCSTATIWPGTDIAENCLVGPLVSIEPFAKIGKDVWLTDGCVVAHDASIGDHCYLAGHAVVLGEATVEPYCFLGANSTIRDRITIARECVVGAGALILKDTREKGVYMGTPSTLLPVPSDELPRV